MKLAQHHTEEIGGVRRPLLLRAGEIERFEEVCAPVGIYEVWDGFMGRARTPSATQVKLLLALGLVGAGMADAAAEKVMNDLPTSDLPNSFEQAKRLLGATFFPAVRASGEEGKKKQSSRA